MRKPAPPVDAVTRYAESVLSGATVAGRAVRLACSRHLHDVARQRSEAFPYYFDTAAAEHIIAFFPEFLSLEDGRPFVLTEWLQFCIGSIFGWKRVSDGLRRFQVGYIETAKGSGKTPTLAGVGLYGLCFDDEPASEIYCLAPETRVLCSDFTWKPVGDLKDGDPIVAFDEHPSAHRKRRRLRSAAVTSTVRINQPCYRISMVDGRQIVASGLHKWFGMKQVKGDLRSWIETRHLRVGSRIRSIGKPWETNKSREAGYLAGVFDGEAAFHKGKDGRSGFRIAFTQLPGLVLSETRRMVESFGFNISPNRAHKSGVNTFEVRSMYDCFRFLGSIRPCRLLHNAAKWMDGFCAVSCSNSYAVVESIEFIGEREVVAIGTSTGTLFAEGLFSHNSAAFDKGQASLILNDAIRMANDSPDLCAMLDIGKYNIAHQGSGSFFRAVSSEHRSKSGPRPYFVLIDELHEHRDATVVTKLAAGFKFRKQPLQLEITNAGAERTGICWQHHEKSLKVLEGSLTDERWFGYVCQLDPCEPCRLKGYAAPADGCAECDDWTDPAVWPKVNPALGVIIQPAYLESQVQTALTLTSEQAMIKRLNFGIWSEAHTIWIPPDRWQACTVPSVSAGNDHRACALGFDMSEKLDLTAGVVALRVEDEPGIAAETIELVDMEGEREVRKPLTLNFSVELIPFFWIPEDTLRERVKNERIPYDVWRRAGQIRVTPGPVIDHDLIYEQVMREIVPAFKPQRIGYDPHNATQFAIQLRDKGKQTVVEVPQGRKLSETFKLLEALVLLRRIRHAGNPVLGFCVSNAEPKRDRYQNLWIEKPSQTKRIDGLIAAVIALSQLVLLPARAKKRSGGAVVWRPDGWASLAGDHASA